jgi:hypothetical protein
LLKDRLKTMLGGASAGKGSSAGASELTPKGPPITRHSSGLEQFVNSIKGDENLSILDFAGATQANVTFITSLGHRLSSEDYLRSLELAFSDGDFYANQNDPEQTERFLAENLNFPPEHFDGALVWDALQFLAPQLLQTTVDRLYDTLKPNSSMLAFFHSDEKTLEVPLYQYRIGDQKTLLLTPRGSRARAQFFNNRGLEKLFQRFQSVKFFLTRDSLREVIVRR